MTSWGVTVSCRDCGKRLRATVTTTGLYVRKHDRPGGKKKPCPGHRRTDHIRLPPKQASG